VVLGFLLGIILAWGLSASYLLSRTLASLLGPITDLLRGIPPACIIPFFILWFGFEPSGKLLLIAINVVLIVYPALVAQFKNAVRDYSSVCAAWDGGRGSL
jgi:ABC-type nitrate/sulfonate/bicarbonate transport system permease component